MRPLVYIMAGLCLAAAGEARGDWIVRAVATSPYFGSPTVMVNAGGQIALGYISAPASGPGLVQLTRLAGHDFSTGTLTDKAAWLAGFSMDGLGGVHYGFQATGQSYVGYDLPGWESGSVIGAVARPTMTADSHGIPWAAGDIWDSGLGTNVAAASHFDIRTGKWLTESVGVPIAQGYELVSAAVDNRDQPVMAYYLGGPTPTSTVMVSARGDDGWQTTSYGQGYIYAGLSVAVSKEGTLGLAYASTLGRLVVHTGDDQPDLTVQGAGHLTRSSLAFDSQGNPGLAYYYNQQFHLYRRDSGGVWTDLLLPVRGSWTGSASLAFDAQDNPYVLAVSGTNLVLLGPAVPAIPGDIDGNNIVDQADYTVWYNRYGMTGATWADGDLTGDGLVDQADYTVWYNHYGATSGSIPEPATPYLLSLGGLAMLRRRT